MRRVFAAILLILAGIGLILAVVTHTPRDIRRGEWFLPPPRRVCNVTGPFGAWIAMHVVGAMGYFGLSLGVLLVSWGVARAFGWKATQFLKLTGYVVGWTVALALPVAAVAGEYKDAVIGAWGTSLADLLDHLGLFGKVLVAFGAFLCWALLSTGIGFRRPARLLAQLTSSAVGMFSRAAEQRRRRRDEERRRIIEEYRRRQEQLYRRIAAERTGNIVPGAVPEALLPKRKVPEKKPAEQTSPGLCDDFVPPPIVTAHDRPSEAVEPPFEPSDVEEEVITPPAPSAEPQEEESQAPEPQVVDEELPPWLLRDIPQSAPGLVDAVEVKAKPQEEASGEAAPEVIEVPESPGIEIEPAEAEEPELGTPSPPTPTQPEDEGIVLFDAPYTPPPTSLLKPQPPRRSHYSEAELQSKARKLYEALQTYGIRGRVTAITPGPVITRYEFEPEPGTKVSRIAQLADDLTLALKAQDVRIVAPLPGKGTVGIEVPNPEPEVVHIRSVIESPAFQNTKAALPMALGRGVAGEPVVADLAKMPHLLIAGATGSGKSVCINAIITSLVYKRTPKELRLLLIDPKRLELSIYNGIPFLLAPVVTENKEASAALNWVLGEMEHRYRRLAEARVRKLSDYNKAVEKNPSLGQPLPRIVVIIDELADLMMTVASEVEEPIARLAQMARAVGIHLVIATQRPSVDVVTGIIKANFPSRIAFKVRSRIDSRTILDMGGAERLIGQGDMLYLPSGFADPIRIHGSYVSTEETEALVEYLKGFPNPQQTEISFKEELARRAVEQQRDELFWEAAKIVVLAQKGSASHLQRKLRIGYTRAASLIDQLEAAGIVGPFEGSKAREVLVKSLEELDELRRKLEQ